MAVPDEDGIGGKFRKRSFRRAPATPYDRPPSAAARGGLQSLQAAAAAAANGGGGWLSKLVDPASRLIADGASRIFASFFHKRLPALSSAPEENQLSRQEVTEVAPINPSFDLPGQGDSGGDTHPANNSDIGVSELEDLLKQKTFTRAEFEHLMKLLCSRTVEPATLELAVNNEIKEKENAPAQEKEVENSGLYDNLSTPARHLTILKEEAACPAELAKAYMGSRPSKVSPSTLCLSSQAFQEDARSPTIVPYLSKTSNLPNSRRSTICFSKSPPRIPDNGFQTPEYRGRSAMTRMSCSPYFKINPTTNTNVGGATEDVYSGPSLGHLTSKNLLHAGGKQVLKRGITVLDNDSGSLGTIRRIRQRSSLMSSKDKHLTPSFKIAIGGSTSVHKPSWFDESKYQSIDLKYAENKADKTYAKVTPIPPKSSETAMKILQHLDKMVPSPKEKSSERKSIALIESPSKSKHDILAGVTPKSLQEIDSSEFLNVQGSDSMDSNKETHLLSHRNSLSEKQYKLEQNGVSKSSAIFSAAMPSIDAKTGSSCADIVISGSAKIHSLENSVFQIGAREVRNGSIYTG